MQPGTILFATNRVPINDARRFSDVGHSGAWDADNLACGLAEVTGTDIADADSGTIQPLAPTSPAKFSDGQIGPMLASANDVLVFIHGAANDFNDAITRAAYNQAWLGNGGIGKQFDMIAYTWPGRDYDRANLLGMVNLAGDYTDYRHDQAQAQGSAPYTAQFLRLMYALRQRIGSRKLHLLCHSMGNYALGAGVQALFAQSEPPPHQIFDEVILAAADEPNGTFDHTDSRRLADLWKLGREITCYCSRADILMTVSRLANGDTRLGYAGALDQSNTGFYSTNVYEFVDCSGVNDSIGHGLLDSHQYYRESPRVRQDILGVLAGLDPADLKRLGYDKGANMYSLFPPKAAVPHDGRAGDGNSPG